MLCFYAHFSTCFQFLDYVTIITIMLRLLCNLFYILCYVVQDTIVPEAFLAH